MLFSVVGKWNKNLLMHVRSIEQIPNNICCVINYVTQAFTFLISWVAFEQIFQIHLGSENKNVYHIKKLSTFDVILINNLLKNLV